jgi:hypothetical protein
VRWLSVFLIDRTDEVACPSQNKELDTSSLFLILRTDTFMCEDRGLT